MHDYAPAGLTLTEAIVRFESEGFTGQLAPRAGGLVACLTCHEESRASEVDLRAMLRIEGASDPGDMTAVAALTCPRCGARGTLALTYGPEAPPEDADVLAELADDRVESGTSTEE